MQCSFIKDNKEQCQAHAMKYSDYCFLHNPDISEQEKKTIQSQGGKGNLHTIPQALERIEVNDIKSISYLLKDTINRVRS